jgi:FAD/FMN-containing dehydrogenase
VTSVTDQLRYLSRGAYVNFLDAADQHRLDEVYPEKTRRRLADVKTRYDPHNLFHRNLNIRPVVDG